MKLNENRPLSRYEWAQEQVLQLLPLSTTKIVSDIGAGDARLRAPIEGAGGEWIGYDSKLGTVGVLKWNIEEAADPKFPHPSIVLLLDVLEHLCNPWSALQNISEHLLPGGYLVLTTPNPRWSVSRTWALLTGTPICFTQDDLNNNHHVFAAWPHIVERMLSDCELEVIRYDTLDGKTSLLQGLFTIRFPVRFIFRCINRCIELRDRTACGRSYGIVARRVNKRPGEPRS
jgi:2-polyprenyl-3-methyl-5-hydroxy-6-metoxy-1,4-benzoquinol methylase